MRIIGIIVLLSGCASNYDTRPEPETPELHIEDQSANAPPPPPPSAPPADAQDAPPNAPPTSPNANVAAPPASAPANVLAPPAYAPANLAPSPGSPPPNVTSAPGSPPSAPPSEPMPPPAQEAPPSSAQWAYEYPSGRWVYANGYGWMWVPANAASVDNEGVPYSYLYTPNYGWTWYVSPWGAGPYRYGVWVRHPYQPVGWHGAWVAHPRVVVRLGGGPHYYGHRRRGW